MWRCDTCGKLNSTQADRCHGCNGRAPDPEASNPDNIEKMEFSISVDHGSVPETTTVLNSAKKLKSVFRDLVPEMRLDVLGPGLLKIETTSFVKGTFYVIISLSIIFLILVCGTAGDAGGETIFIGFIQSWSEYLVHMAVTIAVLILSIVLARRYDVYYIINLNSRLILLRRHYFGRIIDRTAGDFSQVKCVAVGATQLYDTSKSSTPL